ncbi:hypothetical protein RCJ22_28510 [Vibrio sp. FNV 38]|nr:hypothetical protein [Vibrio sp. FNV 38]
MKVIKQYGFIGFSMALLSGCSPDYLGMQNMQSHGMKISGIKDQVSFENASTVSFYGRKPADLELKVTSMFFTDDEHCQEKIYGSNPRMTKRRSIIVSTEVRVSADGTRYELSSPLPVTYSPTEETKCQYEFAQAYITYRNQYSSKAQTLFRLKTKPNKIKLDDHKLFLPEVVNVVCSRRLGKQEVTGKDILSGGLICSDSRYTSRNQWLNRQNYQVNFVEGDYYQSENCVYNERIQVLIDEGWVVDHHNNQFGFNRCEG